MPELSIEATQFPIEISPPAPEEVLCVDTTPGRPVHRRGLRRVVTGLALTGAIGLGGAAFNHDEAGASMLPAPAAAEYAASFETAQATTTTQTGIDVTGGRDESTPTDTSDRGGFCVTLNDRKGCILSPRGARVIDTKWFGVEMLSLAAGYTWATKRKENTVDRPQMTAAAVTGAFGLASLVAAYGAQVSQMDSYITTLTAGGIGVITGALGDRRKNQRNPANAIGLSSLAWKAATFGILNEVILPYTPLIDKMYHTRR